MIDEKKIALAFSKWQQKAKILWYEEQGSWEDQNDRDFDRLNDDQVFDIFLRSAYGRFDGPEIFEK